MHTASGELKGLFTGMKAESVFSFNKLLISVLSATLVHLCVSMRVWGMLMRGLPIPCGPRWRVYYATGKAASLSSAYGAGKTDRQSDGKMEGWKDNKKFRQKFILGDEGFFYV